MVRGRMTAAPKLASPGHWHRLDPRRARDLVDARLQFHHAAQLATAAGISFLPARPDDSHTNLEWIPTTAALASRRIPATSPFRVAVRPWPFALLILDERNELVASHDLHGSTIEDATRFISGTIADRGVDSRRYTLKRHYEIPAHPVAAGGTFDASRGDRFEELSHWYADAALILDGLVASTPSASEVRSWPHHFDIATLITVEPATGAESAHTVGVGMQPGDEPHPEPYWYVNMTPSPDPAGARPALAGGGHWHMRDWLGAALPASHLTDDDQRAQLDAFIASAVEAYAELARSRR